MAGLWRVRFTDVAGQAVRRLSRSVEPAGNRAPRRAGQLPAARLRRAAGGRDERHAAAGGNRRPRRRAPAGRADPHDHLLAAADVAGRHEPFCSNASAPVAVRLVSKGYGSCRILSTATRNVWSVQFFNAMDEIVLDTLEIGDAPARGLRGGSGFPRQRHAPARDRGGLFRMTGFENFGKQRNVDDDAKMECGVCWHVYDPARGRSRLADPAGHAFLGAARRLALPQLRRGAGALHEARRRWMKVRAESRMRASRRTAGGAFPRRARAVDEGRADLQREPRGRQHGLSALARLGGRHRRHALVHEYRRGAACRRASGRHSARARRRAWRCRPAKVEFLAADLDGFDRLLMCSLFSPMQDFVDQEAALATAQAALDRAARRRRAEVPPPEKPRADNGWIAARFSAGAFVAGRGGVVSAPLGKPAVARKAA